MMVPIRISVIDSSDAVISFEIETIDSKIIVLKENTDKLPQVIVREKIGIDSEILLDGWIYYYPVDKNKEVVRNELLLKKGIPSNGSFSPAEEITGFYIGRFIMPHNDICEQIGDGNGWDIQYSKNCEWRNVKCKD